MLMVYWFRRWVGDVSVVITKKVLGPLGSMGSQTRRSTAVLRRAWSHSGQSYFVLRAILGSFVDSMFMGFTLRLVSEATVKWMEMKWGEKELPQFCVSCVACYLLQRRQVKAGFITVARQRLWEARFKLVPLGNTKENYSSL